MNYSCRWRAVTPLTTRGAETGIIKFFQEDSDLAHVVSSLSNGTELEVNFGKSLQVRLTAMSSFTICLFPAHFKPLRTSLPDKLRLAPHAPSPG